MLQKKQNNNSIRMRSDVCVKRKDFRFGKPGLKYRCPVGDHQVDDDWQ